MHSVHQCARFGINPKVEHGRAVKHIGRCLLGTRTKGHMMQNDPTRGLETHSDADFAGAWDPEIAGDDMDTAGSRHGHVTMHAGAPILWKSAMQTEIALSSTESELIGPSMALREGIPILRMLEELQQQGFDVNTKSTIKCTLFEDNNGTLEIARVPKMRPRTKHVNCKCCHFMSHTKGEQPRIPLQRIGTEENCSDTLTKPNEVTNH